MISIKFCFFYALLVLTFCHISVHASEMIRCSQCRKQIRGGQRYLMYNNQVFCSAECQRKVMPKCAACGNHIVPGKKYLLSKNKPYCSRKCLATIMPECTVCGKRSFNGGIYAADHTFFACPECMKLPRCFSCSIPVRGGKMHDGRTICRKCSATGISDPGKAKELFNQVRAFLKKEFSIGTNHRILFFLTDNPTLHRLSKDVGNAPGTIEQGLFKLDAIITETTYSSAFHKEKVSRAIDTKYHIYVLDHLPPERMASVMAHELGHDWMSSYCPGIKEQWIREGTAQYISWLYNKHFGYRELNIQIEKNKDPVYGDGFRRIRNIAETEGFSGLKRFLKSKKGRKFTNVN